MNLITPKHLSVVSMAVATLIISIGGLPRVSSSYAQIQQNSRGRSTPSARSTPVPASLQVNVQYPPDGTISPGKSQVVRAEVIIGPPQGVSPRKYLVITKLSDAQGDVVCRHTYHPVGEQSVGRISMRRLPPGDYTFSIDLQYADTTVAQSGSSKIRKIGRTNPKSSATPTPTPTATPTPTPTLIPTATPAPTGSATPVSGYATTWVANTFRGGGQSDGVTATKMHLQQSAADMTVLPNGTVGLNHNWDEGHMYMGMYAIDGTIQGQQACPSAGSLTAGASMANNGTYVFGAQNPTYSTVRTGDWTTYVGRWNLDGTPAGGFTGAAGDCGNLQTIDASPNGSLPVWGLAASSTEVYVADPNSNQIKVYDTNLQFKRSWSFTNPRRIAYDPTTNSLWISSGTNAWSSNTQLTAFNQLFIGNIYHQDLNGNPYNSQPQPTITTAARPSGLAVHTGNLYVADDGPDQNIKIFNATTGAFVGTFGAQGGYLSGVPGILSSTKLMRPGGIGFDSSNNMYILGAASSLDTTMELKQNTGKSLDLRKYDSGGNLAWDISAPGGFDDNSVVDPASETDWYSSVAHFRFDYDKLTTGAGGGGQEWSSYSSTIDPFTYPHDPRQYQMYPNAVQMRTISGNKYFAVSDELGHQCMLFRMVGEIAKPMNVFASYWNMTTWPNQPSTSFYWFDSNNDGEPQAGEMTNTAGGSGLNTGDRQWDFDANGGVWVANDGNGFGIGYWPMQGINGNQQLTYNVAGIQTWKPSPFTQVNAVQYDAANDVLYVSGYTAASPPVANEPYYYVTGTVLARYNNWLAGNRSAAWTQNLPHSSFGTNEVGTAIRAWHVAGNRIFAGLWQTAYQDGSGAGYPGVPVVHNIYVYDTASGNFLGEMMPGAETSQFMGWIDQNMGLSAFQRSNGEYVVTEEEQLGAKNTVLRGMLNDFTQY